MLADDDNQEKTIIEMQICSQLPIQEATGGGRGGLFKRHRLGTADWTPCRLGTGHLGTVSQFIYIFSSYEEKTMKQAIP